MRNARTISAWLLAACVLAAPGHVRADDGTAKPRDDAGATDTPAIKQAEGAPALGDQFFPVSAARPGLKGYGLTIKSGTRIERFELEIIDVMRNNLTKQDIILVRCLGEAFADHGIAQGMSGSPIYFRDRLAGALSYTWSWSKHAIGGVTPIEFMLPEGTRVLEGQPTGAPPPTPLRQPKAPIGKRRSNRIRPIGTPMAVSGFGDAALAELETLFGRDGFTVGVSAPVSRSTVGGRAVGGHVAGMENVEAPVVPGGTIVVDMMRGDYGISALGTITHVDGDLVYAFGHSFEVLGETLFPASVGYVYTVLASREISFKMGAPVREIGAMVQDRPSCIVIRKDIKAPMVPFALTFKNVATKRQESFNFEITPNTIYFQRLVSLAIREAFTKAEATLGPNTKRYTMTVELEGLPPWTYTDTIAGFDGGFQRILMHLVDRPLIHVTQRPVFKSVRLDVEIEHRDRRATIHSAIASQDEVQRGDQLTLLVGLKKRDGGDITFEKMDVTVPHDAPLGNYVIRVVGGDYVAPDVPNYKDIADLPKIYEAYHKSTELVAVLPTTRVDAKLFGTTWRRMPLSALTRLVRSPGGDDLQLAIVTEKVTRAVPYVLRGSHNVTVRVVR